MFVDGGVAFIALSGTRDITITACAVAAIAGDHKKGVHVERQSSNCIRTIPETIVAMGRNTSKELDRIVVASLSEPSAAV